MIRIARARATEPKMGPRYLLIRASIFLAGQHCGIGCCPRRAAMLRAALAPAVLGASLSQDPPITAKQSHSALQSALRSLRVAC